jgi:hypothetical protein
MVVMAVQVEIIQVVAVLEVEVQLQVGPQI